MASKVEFNVKTEKKDKFYQLIWRPRPPTLLTEAKEKEIRKNLRTYSKKYEEEDAKLRAMEAALEAICDSWGNIAEEATGGARAALVENAAALIWALHPGA